MKKPRITRQRFIAATGYEPQDDDLERCNCPEAGQIGHTMCGWNDRTNLPVFMSAIRLPLNREDA